MPLRPVLKMVKNAYFCLLKCSTWVKIGFWVQVFGCPSHHHEYLGQLNQLWKYQNMPMTSKEAANLTKIEKCRDFEVELARLPHFQP